jgi:protein-tyrosine phosphatase
MNHFFNFALDTFNIATNDYNNISKITDNIYLSGIHGIINNMNILGNIPYIISCVDIKYSFSVHQQVVSRYPHITIFYLPMEDTNDQCLWDINTDHFKFYKYIKNPEDYNSMMKMVDGYSQKSFIEIAYHLIDSIIAANQKVLVHCMAGVSRSTSFLIYYFMKKYNYSYYQALNFISARRSIVSPNISFKNQLLIFQEKRENFTYQDAKAIADMYSKM